MPTWLRLQPRQPFKFLQLELGLDPFVVDKLVGLIPILENVLFLACTLVSLHLNLRDRTMLSVSV